MSTEVHPRAGGRLRRLLVCFDGSDESEQAAELALDLARHLGAELAIFSVLPDTSHLETTEARASADRSAREQLLARSETLRSRAATDDVRLIEIDVSGGDPADRIAAHATQHGFDLVVVGSHGQDRATHGGPGRVVERLIRDPQLPVLVVPDFTKA